VALFARSRRAYRALAGLLYPRDFRDGSAAALEEAAIACLARERARLGRIGVVTGWVGLLRDTAVTAVQVRWQPAVSDELTLRLDDDIRHEGRMEALIDGLRKDLRYALRSLRRQPGFTIVTMLTLALGIGANTAVFSVVNGVLLRPLPYANPERLEFITSQFPAIGFDQFWVDLPEFVDFRDHNQAFASVGAYTVGAVNLDTSPPSRPVNAVLTAELMPTLGVRPLYGRWFSHADTLPNAPAVSILSYELWQRAFGGDPSVVGKVVQVNNAPEEIVGIMPRGFDIHDEKVEIYQPLTIDPAGFADQRGGHFLYMIGRLKDGVSRPQAQSDIDRMLAQWKTWVPQGHTPTPTNHRLRMDPLLDDVVGGVRQALAVLQAAVGFVLLIACANLANLLVARADSRTREYSVRAALGATRGRLFRQLLTEGLVLTTAAAAVGLGLSYAGLQALLAINPDAIPRTAEIALDTRVLVFTLSVAALTGLVFALVPLVHLGAAKASQAIREASARTTASRARVWLRSLLVAGEVAIAVTLVVGAGLLIRSFMNLTRVDVGFDRAQLSTFGIVLPGSVYTGARRVEFYSRLEAALEAIPGVRSVAAMSGLPPLRAVNANDVDFQHIPNTPPGDGGLAENVDYFQYVSLDYAETMGISVVKGRSFVEADAAGAPAVLINEALARKFFADRDPIGGRLNPFFGPEPIWFAVVGVLKDVKQGGVAEDAGTELYFLTDQLPRVAGFAPGAMNIVVRSSVPFEGLSSQYRRAVQQLDPTIPMIRLRSMRDVIGTAIARPRFLTVLLGLFAALALVLATVGTYGMLAYLVNERKQEIGIRMAIGADRRGILRLVLGRGLLLSLAGVVAGLAAAAAVTRVISTLLFDVTPTDPLTLFAVAVTMMIVATVACLIPALRATRVDPLIVLREV
jgi:putative ABC transport system permease protein